MKRLARIEKLVLDAEEEIIYLLESLNQNSIKHAQFERERDNVIRGVWTKLRIMILFENNSKGGGT